MASKLAADDPNVLRIGYYGSYARGDWGVGSDLDLVILVKYARAERYMRGAEYPVEELPVPADVVVYTPEELEAVQASDLRFGGVLRDEVVWVLGERPREPERAVEPRSGPGQAGGDPWRGGVNRTCSPAVCALASDDKENGS